MWQARGGKMVAALVGAAVLALLIGAMTAAAQPGPQAGERGAGIERMAERLGLSEQQQAAIVKLREDGRRERQTLRKEMARVRHDLRGELLKDQPSRKQIEKLSADIGALQAKLRANRILQQMAVRDALTPAQRELLPAPGIGLERGERGWGAGARGERRAARCWRDCDRGDRFDRGKPRGGFSPRQGGVGPGNL